MPDTAVDAAQPAFVPARQFFAVPLRVADHNVARSIAGGGHAMRGVVVVGTPATVRHGSDGVARPGRPIPAATGQNRLIRVARTDERSPTPATPKCQRVRVMPARYVADRNTTRATMRARPQARPFCDERLEEDVRCRDELPDGRQCEGRQVGLAPYHCA